MTPALRDALEQAYSETTYRVYVPGAGAIDLRPGARCPALDRLLARAGAREWAFITAWNPGSRQLPAWRNAHRQQRLLALLAHRAVLPGVGIPASLDWPPEESLFVAGLPRGRALQLARCFGQHAVVAGRRGRAARLAWTR